MTTNFEKIKAMTIEEMTKFLENITINYNYCYYCYIKDFCKDCPNCYLAFKQWLEAESEG
jgi:hypothetical protein